MTDYKAWAYGLKKAGYATDPAYPTKLIKLIEDYKLYQFDTRPSGYSHKSRSHESTKDRPSHKAHNKEPESKVIPQSPNQIEQVKVYTGRKREEFRFSLSREMYSRNEVPFVYSMEGETYRSIAESNNLFVRELLKFNDLDKDEALLPGTVVYLQKKKNEAERGLNMHVIEAGETLRSIAQRYGVRLKSLKKLNEIENENLIREGDILRLRK